jgi:hypothetical protein
MVAQQEHAALAFVRTLRLKHDSIGNFFAATVMFVRSSVSIDWDPTEIEHVINDLGSMLSADLALDRRLYELQDAVFRCSSERIGSSEGIRSRVSVHTPVVIEWSLIEPALLRTFVHASVSCEQHTVVWEQRPFAPNV